MQPHQFHIQRIDHTGLVAGMCKELGIANLLDSLVPNQSETRKISFGSGYSRIHGRIQWQYKRQH